MSTATHQERVRGQGAAWKGTILLVGMLSLLTLLGGCYTVVASQRALPRTAGFDTAPEGDADQRTAVDAKAGLIEENLAGKMAAIGLAPGTGGETFAEQEPYEPQSFATGYSGDLYADGSKGVGVRYRDDLDYSGGQYTEYVYDYDLDQVVFSYRRPWFRRMYVDWYYATCYNWHRFPRRFGRVWSAGFWWGGFGVSYGYYDPWWYDPYYWDYWWTDPWYSSPWYSPCYSVCYIDPWWFGYEPYYYGFYDPYWGSYWYYDHPWHGSGRGTVVVAQDYERRDYDRRRGLSDLRTARGARGVAADAGSDDARSSNRTGRAVADASTARSAARGRTGADRGAGDSAAATRSRNPATSPTVRNVKVRSRPDDRAATRTLRVPSNATRTETRKLSSTRTTARRPSSDSGSSGSRSLIRDLGGRLIRAATGNSRTSSGSSRTSSGSSRTSSGSSRTSSGRSSTGSRATSRVTRPRTSRPPPSTSSTSGRTGSTRVTTSRPTTSGRTTSSRTTGSRTTSSRPPTTSSSRATSSRTTSGRTTSGRTTSSRVTSRPPPRTTTSRPPPRTSSSSGRTTSARTTTSSRPPTTSSSRATSSRTTSSRTTSSRTTSGRTTSSRVTSRPPPRTTTSRPPPRNSGGGPGGH